MVFCSKEKNKTEKILLTYFYFPPLNLSLFVALNIVSRKLPQNDFDFYFFLFKFHKVNEKEFFLSVPSSDSYIKEKKMFGEKILDEKKKTLNKKNYGKDIKVVFFDFYVSRFFFYFRCCPKT